MTPYETALRFMRQRGTTTSHPDFIVAYLREEASRTKDGNPLRLSPHPYDRARFVWGDLKDAIRPLMRQINDAAVKTSVEMGRLREATEAGLQFQNDTSDQPFGRIP